MKKRVVTAEFLHETNSFSKRPTNYQSFVDRHLSFGKDSIEKVGDANTGLAGFLDASRKCGWEVHHVLSAHAQPSGLVETETFERLSGAIIEALRPEHGPVDGVLLALHGAMVVQHFEDGEGELLRRIRDIVGPETPVAITLDLHANCSQAMCELANVIVSFKTYPHVDMRLCGEQAGLILDAAMHKRISPVTIRAHRPMLEEANSGRTDTGPMVQRVARMREYESRPGVLAVSINAGFPTDISTGVGPTVLCTFDALQANSGIPDTPTQTQHQLFIESLADDIWTRRREVLNTFLTVPEAIAVAQAHCETLRGHLASAEPPVPVGPLIIADYADNPGAGSYGDGTNLLRALLQQASITDAVVAPIVDAEAAAYIHATFRSGDRVSTGGGFLLGGKMDALHGGGPVLVEEEAEVLLISDGKYVGSGPMIGGIDHCFGPTAVLRLHGRVVVLVVSEAEQMLDLSQLETFGIFPAEKQVLVLKSMQHFRAAFAPIAAAIVVCDSGALATPNLCNLHFEKVPRPIFPLDDDFAL